MEAVRRWIQPELPADSVGFIFVDRGRVLGADFFGCRDLARALLPKLLDACSVEELIRRPEPADGERADGERADAQAAAIAFFERIRNAGSERAATPGSGAGIRTRAAGLLGDGVSLDGGLVHYGVQPAVRMVPRPIPIPMPHEPRR